MRLKVEKTPTGKNKIVDENGFSIATASFHAENKNIERLVACFNALEMFKTEDILEREFLIGDLK